MQDNSADLRCRVALLLSVIGLLVGCGCDANSDLQDAADACDEAQARRALESGADPNSRNERADTPLHVAAMRFEGTAVSRLLINAGADVNARNYHGWTPLHRTVTPMVALLLLDAGAEVSARDKFGLTPLHILAGTEHGFVQPGHVVVQQGDESGAIKQEIVAGYARQREELLNLLLSTGADPNAKDDSGQTPLHRAAGSGQAEHVSLLLKYGADPSVKDDIGDTPADLAKQHGYSEVADLLRGNQVIGDPTP